MSWLKNRVALRSRLTLRELAAKGVKGGLTGGPDFGLFLVRQGRLRQGLPWEHGRFGRVARAAINQKRVAGRGGLAVAGFASLGHADKFRNVVERL